MRQVDIIYHGSRSVFELNKLIAQVDQLHEANRDVEEFRDMLLEIRRELQHISVNVSFYLDHFRHFSWANPLDALIEMTPEQFKECIGVEGTQCLKRR